MIVKMIQKLLIGLIRCYQSIVSPYLATGRCRFTPSCSQYAITAIQLHGIIKGSSMALRRLFRCKRSCQKLEKSVGKSWGYDPVPHQVKRF